MGSLYFGDNLDVLRKYVKDESADLIYLDPPFNSNATYSVIFKDGAGAGSEAQAEAFRDTWTWGPSAAAAYEELQKGRGDLAVLMQALRACLGPSGRMAYLAMMGVRLIELKRALKPTGSLYLHCDPTESHYLKLLLDTIFGEANFRSEVIWKRTSAHSAARRWGDVHDTILFYTASDRYTWNKVFTAYDEAYLKRYKNRTADGIPYTDDNLTAPGVRNGFSGKPWRGYNPTEKGLHWKVSASTVVDLIGAEAAAALNTIEKLDVLDQHGLIHFTSGAGFPRFKRPLGKGLPPQDIITDIPPVNSQSQQRLGYPTQKPVTLLERIIKASSNEGDVILDPFCGCGTTVEAAEQTKREWLGIDVTHYAITLIEKRLRRVEAATPMVVGRPTDLAGARELAVRDKYQFQWWAAWRLGAQTYEGKKGGDRGVDANIYFANGPYGLGRIIISVKAGENLNPGMVRDLAGTVAAEGAEMGLLVTMAEPTRGMISAAADQGFVAKTPHGRLPKVQIVTAEDLLLGRMPKLPPLPVPEDGPTVRRRREKDQLELLLPFAGSASLMLPDGAMVDPRFVRFA